MTKKTISLFVSILLCFSLVVPTWAEETTFSSGGLNIPDAQSQVNLEVEESLEALKKETVEFGSAGSYRLGSMNTFDGNYDLSKGTKFSSSIAANGSASSKDIVPHISGSREPDISEKGSGAETGFDENAQTLVENSPPVASLEYVILNPESLYNNQVTVETQIAWLYSFEGTDFTYDPDGDAITGMYIGGVPEECIVGELPDMGFITQFPQTGTFTLLFQVEDEHGALSDVWGMNITVVNYSAIRNLNMNTTYGGSVTPSYKNSKGFLNYRESMSMVGSPEYIWDSTISQDYPYELPSKRFFNDIKISGVVTHPDGTPRANESVIVYMPLSLNYALYETLTTDASGKFSIEKNVARDIYNNESSKYITKGDCSGNDTQYSYVSKDVNGQDFYYPTQLTIACNYEIYKEDVTATVGYVINGIILGGRWLWSADLANGDPILRWHEI